MQDTIPEASEPIMDEFHFVCSAEKVTISVNYLQSARSITLAIIQRDGASGHKSGYQLEVTESYHGRGSKFAIIGSDMGEFEFLKDLSDFVMSPSEYSPSSSPRQPLTSLRFGQSMRHDWDASSSEGSLRSTSNLHVSKHDSSKDAPSSYPSLVHASETDCATGAYLLKLLDVGDFDKGLIDEFKVVINMVRHMSYMLFKGDKAAGSKITASTLEEVEALAIEVINYFDKMGDKFEHAISEINEIKKFLPNLGPEVKTTHLRVALKIWNEKIMGTLACPQQCEKDLFDGFAIFYDAQIYHAFLQLRRENRKHKVCQLTEHFDTIENYVGHVCAKYNIIIREMGTFATAMRGAKKRLLSDLAICHQTHQEERHLKRFKRELAKQMNESQTDHASTAPQPDLNNPGDPADGPDGAAAYTMSQYLERITARLALADARSPRMPPSPIVLAMAKKHASKSEDTKGSPKHVASEPRRRRGFPVVDKGLKPEVEQEDDGDLGWFH